jgi:hypothetical protein
MGLTLAGSTTSAARSRPQSSSTTPVTVSFGATTIASGTLDGSGFAELTFNRSIPTGSTVIATIGSGASAIVASIVLAASVPATAAEVVFKPGPPATIEVDSEDDPGNGHFSSGGNENEQQDENPQDGDPTTVVSGNNPMLPTNLPLSVIVCGATITLAVNTAASPPPAGSFRLEFREKVNDNDENAQLRFIGDPFTSSVTVPALASAARIEIKFFENQRQVLEIKAPLDAFTPATGATPNPATCPTLTPLASPSAGASDSPEPSESPESPEPSESPESPEPSESPGGHGGRG